MEAKEPTSVVPVTPKEVKGTEYTISFLFKCSHCGATNAIADPKLVVVGLHGGSVKLACPGCREELVAQPKNRVVGAQIGAPATANHHQRRAQKACGLVGPTGRPVG